MAEKALETRKPSRTFAEFKNDRVNEQLVSMFMLWADPSEGNVSGYAEHPLTVTVALGAELSIVTVIG